MIKTRTFFIFHLRCHLAIALRLAGGAIGPRYFLTLTSWLNLKKHLDILTYIQTEEWKEGQGFAHWNGNVKWKVTFSLITADLKVSCCWRRHTVLILSKGFQRVFFSTSTCTYLVSDRMTNRNQLWRENFWCWLMDVHMLRNSPGLHSIHSNQNQVLSLKSAGEKKTKYTHTKKKNHTPHLMR